MPETDPTTVFFDNFVVSAIADYQAAETELGFALHDSSGKNLNDARLLVIRRARTAAIELHQFADRVFNERPAWAPAVGLKNLRAWLRDEHARKFAGDRAEDVDVLHDVADAFKHAQLTRSAIYVSTDRAVVSMSTGYGDLGYGEGNYGGAEQVIVQISGGRAKAMSFVLKVTQNAWMNAMGRPIDW